jgi:hypothetical protein
MQKRREVSKTGSTEFLSDEETKRCFDAAVGILAGLRASYTKAQAYVVVEILRRFFDEETRDLRVSEVLEGKIEKAAKKLYEAMCEEDPYHPVWLINCRIAAAREFGRY